MDTYKPSQELLDKYADVFINFALNGGKGIRPGEVAYIVIPESARPMYDSLYKATIKAGAHPLMDLVAEGTNRFFYENATDEQLSFFPEKYIKGLVDQMDHLVAIISDNDPKELEGIDSKLIFTRQKARKPWMLWRKEKENEGKLFWTLGMYATPAMAKEANLSLKEYWEEIINACYLNEDDPVAHWRNFKEKADSLKSKLDALDIDYMNIKSKSTDLTIGLGEKRKWLGASCHNIPSFELFISPDWRETRGHIQFTEPLYRYGNLIENAYLEFDNTGRVKNASASTGEDVLLEMIKQENADKVGEFSLTDRRFSKITKFMAQTLFDENVGGPTGNTHIALGDAYQSSFNGDVNSVKDEGWDYLGFNKSSVHTDIVSTENRIVTATLKNGESLVIYKDGEFTI